MSVKVFVAIGGVVTLIICDLRSDFVVVYQKVTNFQVV